jgi:hypothetical protein
MAEPMTIEQIRAMTPDQATAELNRLTEAYRNSGAIETTSAQAALDHFTSDPTIAAKLFAGDIDTMRRFTELTTAAANSDGRDRLAEMIVDGDATIPPHVETVANGELTASKKLDAIDWLREAGLGDGAVMEAFTGMVATPTEIARAKALKAQLTSDPEWVKALFAGGHEQRRQLTLLSVILAGAA